MLAHADAHRTARRERSKISDAPHSERALHIAARRMSTDVPLPEVVLSG
jgi:hypothetical protein